MAVNSEKTVWVLHDGRAGHWRQARALAGYLPATAEEVNFQLKAPWRLLAPRSLPLGLTMHPQIRAALPGIKPDAIISCGRQSALLARWLQQKLGPQTRTVQILDCGIPPARFNYLITPVHDDCTGRNVIQSLGSLNPIDESWLMSMADEPEAFHRLPRPRVAVLLGGPSRHFDFSRDWFLSRLAEVSAWVVRRQGSLVLVASPRTPAWMAAAAQAQAAALPLQWIPCDLLPSAESERLYGAAIAHADCLVVTADSVNLVSEACASGKPVLLMGRRRVNGRVGRFCERMIADGYVQPLDLADCRSVPATACLRETEEIAKRLMDSGLLG